MAQEIKTYSARKSFAAMRPNESLKYLRRRAARDAVMSIMHVT